MPDSSGQFASMPHSLRMRRGASCSIRRAGAGCVRAGDVRRFCPTDKTVRPPAHTFFTIPIVLTGGLTLEGAIRAHSPELEIPRRGCDFLELPKPLLSQLLIGPILAHGQQGGIYIPAQFAAVSEDKAIILSLENGIDDADAAEACVT